MVVGLSQLPARRRGTHCQHTFVVWRTAQLHLDDYLRLICFLITSVYSALAVSAIMRYINRRFTYLLTYSLGDLQRQCGSDRGPGMYLYSRCKRPTEERSAPLRGVGKKPPLQMPYITDFSVFLFPLSSATTSQSVYTVQRASRKIAYQLDRLQNQCLYT